eukprot:s5146_g4.t1
MAAFGDVGAVCSLASCRRQDFLPTVCFACQRPFCKDHYRQEDHECEALQEAQEPSEVPSPVRRSQQRCAAPGCRELLTVPGLRGKFLHSFAVFASRSMSSIGTCYHTPSCPAAAARSCRSHLRPIMLQLANPGARAASTPSAATPRLRPQAPSTAPWVGVREFAAAAAVATVTASRREHRREPHGRVSAQAASAGTLQELDRLLRHFTLE